MTDSVQFNVLLLQTLAGNISSCVPLEPPWALESADTEVAAPMGETLRRELRKRGHGFLCCIVNIFVQVGQMAH
jgi:hypothetical protein